MIATYASLRGLHISIVALMHDPPSVALQGAHCMARGTDRGGGVGVWFILVLGGKHSRGGILH